MKIILVGRFNELDILTGPEKVAKKLFQTLQTQNNDTQFITYFFKDLVESTFFTRLFGYCELVNNFSIIRMGIIRIIMLIIRKKPEIIHFITFERFYIPLLILKPLFNTKMIYTIHGLIKEEMKNKTVKRSIVGNLKDYLAEYLLVKFADKVVFLSTPSLLKAKQYYEIEDKMYTIIPNGVEKKQQKTKKKFDLINSFNICFYNGSTNGFDRGLKQLLSILKEIKEVNFTLNVIGKVELVYSQKIKIKYFDLMGEQKLYNFLQLQDVCIDSLFHTTQPLFALETMSQGIICVTSSDSGISDLIQNGVNGFVYNSSSPWEINQIIVDIYCNKFDLKELSDSAITTSEKLNWNAITSTYSNLYKDVLSKY